MLNFVDTVYISMIIVKSTEIRRNYILLYLYALLAQEDYTRDSQRKLKHRKSFWFTGNCRSKIHILDYVSFRVELTTSWQIVHSRKAQWINYEFVSGSPM